MEITPIILMAIFGIATLAEKLSSKNRNEPVQEKKKQREYTPEERRQYIRIYNEFLG